MGCEKVKLAGVAVAILCGPRGKRPIICAFCSQPGNRLCDFVIEVELALSPGGGPKEKTCDKPLCAKCAIHVEPDADFCPSHHRTT